MSELKTSPVSKSKKWKSLNDARTILVAALGDNSEMYFMQVRDWFKRRTSKKVIDSVARRSLKHEGLMCYHDTFIETLMNNVLGLDEESLYAAHEILFPGGLVCPRLSKYYKPASPVQLSPSQNQDTNVKMAEVTMAEHSYLASKEHVHCRFILSMLEQGLQQVEPVVLDVVVEATRTFLKNVLTAIVDDVAPYKRCSWSHMFNIEPSTSMKSKQVLYRQEEAYDKDTLINVTYRENALLGLLRMKPDDEDDSPEDAAVEPMPSNEPQPAETTVRLTASHLFHTLMRTPRIIAHRSLLAQTVAHAAMHIRHD